MTMPNKGVTGPLNLTVSHLQRTFHPTLRITVHPSPSNPVRPDCYALLHFTFPDEVFVDKDELVDRWGKNTVPKPFGESKTSAGSGAGKKEKNGFGVVEWTIRPDVVDIERPVISSLSDTEEESREEGLKVVDGRTRLSVAMEIPDIQAELDIPLHGRYLRPDESGEREVVVFGEGGGEMRGMWMCNMHPDQSELKGLSSCHVPVHFDSVFHQLVILRYLWALSCFHPYHESKRCSLRLATAPTETLRRRYPQ